MRWLFALPPLLLFGKIFFSERPFFSQSPPLSCQRNSLAFWIFLALAVTLVVMFVQPMNFDEHGQLVRALGQDSYLPGNHWLARLFSRLGVEVTGRRWVGGRLFSLLFSFFTLSLWYMATSLFLRPITAAWFSSALFANGLFLFNAVSNRAYSLGIFLVTAWATSVVGYTQTKKKSWAGLALLASALLLGLGAVTHRMLYFVFAIGLIAVLLWSWQNCESRKGVWLAVATAALLTWIAWPYLWELYYFERENGLFYRGLSPAAMAWNRLESISFFYVFGWDRSWQALLGFAFVALLLFSRLKASAPLWGEYFWLVWLLLLPAVGAVVGNMAWEPRFFIFFLPPALFFLAQSLDRLPTASRKNWLLAATTLFVVIPLFQAPRLFANSGGQTDLVNFLDVVAKRYHEADDSCLRCSGAVPHCRWVRFLYLPVERGFSWASQCAHPFIVRIAGNDEIPLPAIALKLSFRYRKDYLLYEPLVP